MANIKIKGPERKYKIHAVYQIYGAEGHRQRATFFPTAEYETARGYILEVNHDVTGTNDFTLLNLMGNTEEDIEDMLNAELYDGIFECCRVGKINEVFKTRFE